jgi:hypothetical protein
LKWITPANGLNVTLEYEIRDGSLVWIRNPYTGVMSYVVDLRGKSFSFTLGNRRVRSGSGPSPRPDAIARAMSDCPFCPGNEHLTPPELKRETSAEVAEPALSVPSPWIIRALNNLFPRIPIELTAGRNESYVVVEDPRHFVEEPCSLDDLMWSGAVSEEQFFKLISMDAWLTGRALENRAVRAVAIRKNQGPESGASQPHIHHQVIGSPTALPAVETEAKVLQANPGLWQELIDLVETPGLILERGDRGVITYQSPIGTFPRSYDIVLPDFCGLLTEIELPTLQAFARALHRILRVLGPVPLDYEIHQDRGLPLHAHVNTRLFPYSNVAGTLNLPGAISDHAAALRHALAHL